MSATNTGNQSVYFNYHKALTGDIFNRAQQNVRRPGVLAGLGVTKQSNTSVSIATGVFAISDGTRTVTINKGSAHNVTVSNTNSYVVARYSYSNTEEWYATFIGVANPLANDVVLAKLNWTSTTLSSIDLTVKTDGNRINDYELFITANSINAYFKDAIQAGIFGNTASGNNWLDKIDNSWFDDTNSPPIESMVGVLPAYTFDKTVNRYFYFYLKTGSAVDIKFRLKYTGSSSSSGNARFSLSYKVLTDGLTSINNITFDATNSENIPTPGGANTMKEVTTTTLKLPSSASAVANKLVLCRVTRDYSNTADTYPGNISMLEMIPSVS
jgi:hypothetical protein